MNRYVLPLIAVLSLGVAPVVQAEVINITYALSGNVELPILGTTVAPVTGQMTVRYQSANGVQSGSAGSVLHGRAVALAGASLNGPISFTAGGAAFTGLLNSNFSAAGPGTLTSGAGDLVLPVKGIAGGFIHCTGTPCSSPLIGLPQSVNVPISLPFGGLLSALGVGPVSGTVATAFSFGAITVGTFAGFPLTAALSAQEIGRHFVPEPSTMPMLALGFAGLAVFARQTRRARR